MSREIVLDTETTGLSPRDGHRIVEIGAVELINHVPSGRNFHVYLDPQRDMPPEAEAVHGLSSAFLKGKPVFSNIAQEFIDFIGDALLVIHNASFDMTFINFELTAAKMQSIDMSQVIDTLQIARAKHPMAPNSLDALCKRYGIDLSRRTKHGALLDSELLAEVYLELIGGRQTALGLTDPQRPRQMSGNARTTPIIPPRQQALPPRLTEEELQLHRKHIASLGAPTLWPPDDNVKN